MFGRTTDDLAEVLMRMQDEARVACKHDQYAIAHRMGDWLSQDRRFDSIKDKVGLAREAMACRASGRQLDLTQRMKSGATSSPGYVAKSF